MTLGALVSAARTLAPDARARVDQARAQDRDVTGIAHNGLCRDSRPSNGRGEVRP
jgi:hypothetical protein